jgi:CHAT domain-containing protein
LKDFRRRYSNESGIYKPLAGELYRLLVAPAEGELSGKTHLVIIPDGILNTLPFQILVDGQGKHLIETRSISYAPSATALIEMLKLADGRRWAAPDVEPILVRDLAHLSLKSELVVLSACETGLGR